MNVPKQILALKTEPDFAKKLESVAASLNGEIRWAESLGDWNQSMDALFPFGALVDLDTVLASTVEERWQSDLRRVKLRPHTKYIPLVGYSRSNQELLDQSHKLGFNETWYLDQLASQLPQVLGRLFNPPIRMVDGWNEPLPPLAIQGISQFNEGDFFEQHELLEEAWRQEERAVRDLYQGILQIGVAFYQMELGNWQGAIKTFRRGLPKLRTLPPMCQGIDLASFLKEAERIHLEITELGPGGLATYPLDKFPHIRIVSPPTSSNT